MSIMFIRSLILYVLVVFAVRLMGKRQLGELQPSELVITILVSDIATLPLEDSNIPLIIGVTPIFALVCFEVVVSCISLKFPALRKMISGSPKIIISNGKIDADVMKELRFSVDDLLMSLREKDIFDLDNVQYAVVETTGTLSAMDKDDGTSDPPMLVVSDGKLLPAAIRSLGLEDIHIKKILSSEGIKLEDTLIMTADSSGKYFIADNKGNSPRTGEGKNDKT